MLIPSKLSRPIRPPNTVMREQLLSLMSTLSTYRLVLINSPAGYGKTTLAAQWAASESYLGWYSLDHSDNQPDRFASYFIAALHATTGAGCPKSEALAQKNHYASLTTLFSQLFVELSEWPHPLYFVIDDYHLITNSVIHEAMRFFIRHQPDNVTLLILSRGLPPLGIAALRVQEQLLELGVAELAFTHKEAHQFFNTRLQPTLSEQESNTLCDEVQGWPTALQLIVLSTRQSHSAKTAHQSARRLAGVNDTHLADYLTDEVLNHLPDNTRSFLLRSSVLRSMNDSLISKLNCTQDQGQQLQMLEKQGLFIHRMDSAGEWFCFHPLFASFLQQRCQWEFASELPRLHRAAAEGWMELGIAAEAIHHALAAHDLVLLQEILQQYAWPLFHQSKLALLDQCLQALPQQNLNASPRLILLQAWLAQSQHRYDQVGVLLDGAKTSISLQNKTLSIELRAEFNALLAQVAMNTGKPDEALQLAKKALADLPLSCYYSRIVASSVIGEVHHCQGALAQALPMMQQTEQMSRRHETYHYALWAMLQQSEILIAQGYLQAAYEKQDNAFALIREQHLEQLPMHEFLLRIRAQILWSWGRLDEAEESAREGIAVLAAHHSQQQLQCLSMLARCSLTRGNIENAGNYLQHCEDLLSQGHYHHDWLTNTDKFRVLYWQLTENKKASEAWLLQANRPDGSPCNHFLQGQWRNIVRMQILLSRFDEAHSLLQTLNQTARELHLVSDLNRNLLLSNLLFWLTDRKKEAQKTLLESLSLANQTGFISHFVIEGEMMAQQLRQLLQLNILPKLEQHRAQLILRTLNLRHRQKFAHFDELFVERLLSHPHMPELIRTSPLTQREWQVLGLIYSGYSNEHIASELAVAATTIKTHIRNLYQKLGVTHRQAAIEQAQQLMHMIGFSVGAL